MTDLNLKFKRKKDALAFADQLYTEVDIQKSGSYYMAKFYDISDDLAFNCLTFVVNSKSKFFDLQSFLSSPYYTKAMSRG